MKRRGKEVGKGEVKRGHPERGNNKDVGKGTEEEGKGCTSVYYQCSQGVGHG